MVEWDECSCWVSGLKRSMRLSNGEKEDGIASWTKVRARMMTMKEGTMTRAARLFLGGGDVEEEGTLDGVEERDRVPLVLVVVDAVGCGGEGAGEGRGIGGEEGEEDVFVAEGGGDLFGDDMVNSVKCVKSEGK